MKVAKLMTFQAINSRKLKRSVGVDVPEGLLYDLHDFRCWIGHGLQRKGPGFSWTWRDLPDHMDMTALPDLRLSWHRAQEGPISKHPAPHIVGDKTRIVTDLKKYICTVFRHDCYVSPGSHSYIFLSGGDPFVYYTYM